jgi:hypothetical protein
MLGEHLVGAEHAVGAELALRYDPLSLTEQIGQRALEHHRNAARSVGDDERHADAVALALHASLLHHPADAESAALRRFVRRHLRRSEEEHQVLAESAQHERGRRTEGHHPDHDRCHAPVPRFHVFRVTQNTSRASAANVTPYAPHT